MEKLAPIILFTYKRLDTLVLTIEALKKNLLARDSDLIIFSDAEKNDMDKPAVNLVRAYIKTIVGFNSIKIYESKINKGLGKSIIDGVSHVLETNDSVIVMEDDLVSSSNFIKFMNDSLFFFSSNPQIISITGFSCPIKTSSVFDVYFTHRSSSWGWAIWKDRWETIDWKVLDYQFFKNDKIQRNLFNKMGTDMASMLDRQMNGNLDSWAIRFSYHQFKNGLFSVHPFVSKIENVGFHKEATNTREKLNRFKTILDNGKKIDFNFPNNCSLEKYIIKQFIVPYSLPSRFKYKILNLFS